MPASTTRSSISFWELFARILVYRPVDSLTALYWHLLRRRVRARNRLLRAGADLPFLYQAWLRHHEREQENVSRSAAVLADWKYKPTFEVILHGDCAELAADRSIQSIEAQAYPHWALNKATSESLSDRIMTSKADYLVPLRGGNQLSKLALFRFAEAAQAGDPAPVLFADQDELDGTGARVNPWFKPDWNEELFFGQDYLSDACAIKIELARLILASEVDELVVLAAHEAALEIKHVPHIACHVTSAARGSAARKMAIEQMIAAEGGALSQESDGRIKVQYPLPDALPLVSIIIPTKDRADLLAACLEGVLDRTTYPNIEVLIVDNLSIELRTRKFLDQITRDKRVRVLSYPHPYNYSAINNFAVQHARGDYICLLNNDTEVVEGDWLSAMMRYAIKPAVGAVGAKLLYGDGSIQHAGVVVGVGGAAGHAHRFLKAGEEGYFSMAHLPQYVSAVTAACLLVAKEKFLAVGGLDADRFAIAFNDVDFCLKLQLEGWRNVYNPFAVLVHHESKSRGSDLDRKHIERYRAELKALQTQWKTESYSDPLMNPNLDSSSETFVVGLS